MLGCIVQAEQHDLARTIRVSGSILLSTVSNFLDFFKMGERPLLGVLGIQACRACKQGSTDEVGRSHSILIVWRWACLVTDGSAHQKGQQITLR
jgi:hypothetical protein